MKIYLSIILILLIALSIKSINAYNCCDQTQNTDCTCSDQTGAVGTCDCNTAPKTRQGWLCIYNPINGYDSVNHIKIKNIVIYFYFFKISNIL